MTELRSKYSKEIQDAKSVVNELLLESDDQWKMCKEWANGSVYYRKSPSMSGHIYKVVFELNIGLEKSIQSIYPAPRGFREKWDPNLERSVILKEEGVSFS
ncbi:putative stAR-related lipid transfer protein 5 isoform X2 [Apostichopus japonicus]|uniref:Putative stAR-related lipid transfer protein 5 isoform X2 n=1 Tax=Stichopus japonicus TaxID=307972 RepID=A0A2G8LMR3_STIJA|nr:putative stAR-related lipid transfer protein 5 isoform X2 [Apostichopus japonicus]